MDISIQSRIKNPSLKREEVEATIDHEGCTPRLSEMQQDLSKELIVKKEFLVISRVIPKFGTKQLKVKVHVYEDAEGMKVEASKGREEGKKEEPKKE